MPQPQANRVRRPKLPKGHAKSRVLGLRLTDEEIRKFTFAAKANRKTMPKWIRSVLNAELEILAKKTCRDGYSIAQCTTLIASRCGLMEASPLENGCGQSQP